MTAETDVPVTDDVESDWLSDQIIRLSVDVEVARLGLGRMRDSFLDLHAAVSQLGVMLGCAPPPEPTCRRRTEAELEDTSPVAKWVRARWAERETVR